jgi:hypothetical protein
MNATGPGGAWSSDFASFQPDDGSRVHFGIEDSRIQARKFITIRPVDAETAGKAATKK